MNGNADPPLWCKDCLDTKATEKQQTLKAFTHALSACCGSSFLFDGIRKKLVTEPHSHGTDLSLYK